MTSCPPTKMGRDDRLRRATCKTARPSVRLMGSPANIWSRIDSTPAARASSHSSAMVSLVIRFFE